MREIAGAYVYGGGAMRFEQSIQLRGLERGPSSARGKLHRSGKCAAGRAVVWYEQAVQLRGFERGPSSARGKPYRSGKACCRIRNRGDQWFRQRGPCGKDIPPNRATLSAARLSCAAGRPKAAGRTATRNAAEPTPAAGPCHRRMPPDRAAQRAAARHANRRQDPASHRAKPGLIHRASRRATRIMPCAQPRQPSISQPRLTASPISARMNGSSAGSVSNTTWLRASTCEARMPCFIHDMPPDW